MVSEETTDPVPRSEAELASHSFARWWELLLGGAWFALIGLAVSFANGAIGNGEFLFAKLIFGAAAAQVAVSVAWRFMWLVPHTKLRLLIGCVVIGFTVAALVGVLQWVDWREDRWRAAQIQVERPIEIGPVTLQVPNSVTFKSEQIDKFAEVHWPVDYVKRTLTTVGTWPGRDYHVPRKVVITVCPMGNLDAEKEARAFTVTDIKSNNAVEAVITVKESISNKEQYLIVREQE